MWVFSVSLQCVRLCSFLKTCPAQSFSSIRVAFMRKVCTYKYLTRNFYKQCLPVCIGIKFSYLKFPPSIILSCFTLPEKMAMLQSFVSKYQINGEMRHEKTFVYLWKGCMKATLAQKCLLCRVISTNHLVL